MLCANNLIQPLCILHVFQDKEFDFDEIERKKVESFKRRQKAKKIAEKLEGINKLQQDPVLSQTFAQYYKLPRYLKQKRRLEPKSTSKICYFQSEKNAHMWHNILRSISIIPFWLLSITTLIFFLFAQYDA